jgi:zinc protease
MSLSPQEGLTAHDPISHQLFRDLPARWQLDNGLVVLHAQDNNQALVSVQVWIRTGSIHETDNPGAGLSHFLEHMLFKGTPSRPGKEVASEVQALGGSINAYTAFDRTVYYIDGPAEAFPQIVGILHDMCCNPLLAEADFIAERDVILREIDMCNDDPDRRLSRAMFATAFREHPFRHPVIGHRAIFEEVTHHDLVAYHKNRYKAANMVLSIVGDVSREQVDAAIADTFATAPGGLVRPVLIPAEPNQLAARKWSQHGNWQTCRGALAFKVPSMRHADSPALDLLASMIGSGDSAILRQRLREEAKLVHQIEAMMWNPGDQGLFWIQWTCDPQHAAAVEPAIFRELDHLVRDGLPAPLLDKARRFALVSEIHSRQTMSGQASRMALAEAIVGDLGYPAEYFRQIATLTTADVQAVAARYFVQRTVSSIELLPVASTTATRSAPLKSELPRFRLETLPNGARILLQPDRRLPRVSLRYSGLGGCLYEDATERGLTALMTTLLTRDTRFHAARDLAELIESRGGFIYDSAGNNTFAVGVEVLPEDLALGFQVLEEAILQPAFLDDTFQRERDAQIASILEALDDVTHYARRSLRRNFFGLHPFASPPTGEIESLQHLPAFRLRSHYDKLVVAENAVLTITGDFDPDAWWPHIQGFLLELPASAFRPVTKPFNAPFQTGDMVDNLDRDQAIVMEAYPDCGAIPGQSLVGDLIHEIYSDMSGPLFTAVREEQSLAYFVSASRLLAPHYGMFQCFAGTRPDATSQVFDAFDRELDKLRSGTLPGTLLDHAKTRFKVAQRNALQTNNSRGQMATLNVLFGKDPEEWRTLDNRLAAISMSDLQAFAAQYLDPAQRLRLTVTP